MEPRGVTGEGNDVMVETWLGTTGTQLWLVVASSLGIFAAVITYTRVAGLRSFSKMSSFDFASTVAVGSIMATVAVTDASLSNGLVGLAVIYALQVVVALLRRRTTIEKVIDNSPLLLLHEGRLLEDNLRRAHITHRDLWAKLRAANVADLAEVQAVVLETTGDVSVLHGSGTLDLRLLEHVEGVDAGRGEPQ